MRKIIFLFLFIPFFGNTQTVKTYYANGVWRTDNANGTLYDSLGYIVLRNTSGPTGATGPTGTAGTNGTNGATGPTGTAGTNGTNGATGATGPTGTNGTTVTYLPITTGNDTTRQVVMKTIPDFVFAVTTSSEYYFEGQIHIGCSGAGGTKFTLTVPTGATLYISFVGFAGAFTSFQSNAVTSSGTATTTAFCTVSATTCMVLVHGTITTDGTHTGNVNWQFESVTNLQTTTVFQEGSVINRRKVQ